MGAEGSDLCTQNMIAWGGSDLEKGRMMGWWNRTGVGHAPVMVYGGWVWFFGVFSVFLFIQEGIFMGLEASKRNGRGLHFGSGNLAQSQF